VGLSSPCRFGGGRSDENPSTTVIVYNRTYFLSIAPPARLELATF